MVFSSPLELFLPADAPNRAELVAKAARHLELIVETNQQFNLTRILDPVEAAVKHVVDSVMPWRHFAGAKVVADAGSGPGFPGIPLAIALPDVQFTLLESTGKKARFLESAVQELKLRNVAVFPVRAEDWFKSDRADIVTARAVAPLVRALPLFRPALKKGSRVLLYKGSAIEQELADVMSMKDRKAVRVVETYALPMEMGTRTLVEITNPAQS
ncbi:MAG: 16S rRNA (guanine(527)-N(7))-methyltransferase RsmG [Acidobacteria bacterium]|nr:16S rRNA (guanine(527)-N(7))-methyltransferase RsmG [Acidobacteriota bacterium]